MSLETACVCGDPPQFRHYARWELLLGISAPCVSALRISQRLPNSAHGEVVSVIDLHPVLPEVPGSLDDGGGAEVERDDLLGDDAHHSVHPLETPPDQQGR
jgi:hypothetical protein